MTNVLEFGDFDVENMMYAGATPWHGLGDFVGDEPILSAEAIVRAGLNWTGDDSPLFALSPTGEAVAVESHKAIVRNTDQRVLGVVGKKWAAIQNVDAFGFMDSLVDEGLMRYHTAGSLGKGSRVWMLAKVGDTEVLPGDKVDHYLFLYNGFDGKTSLRVLWTDVRVVCRNTARAALSQGRGEGISIRHTGNLSAKLSQAQDVLGISQSVFDDSANFMKVLADTKMTPRDWVDFCVELVPEPPTDEDGNVSKRGRTRVDNQRQEVTSLFLNGTGSDIPGVSGTAWAAYNAVTEYASFHRATRSSQERRFESLLFGAGNDFVKRGTNLLSEFTA